MPAEEKKQVFFFFLVGWFVFNLETNFLTGKRLDSFACLLSVSSLSRLVSLSDYFSGIFFCLCHDGNACVMPGTPRPLSESRFLPMGKRDKNRPAGLPSKVK